MTGYLGPFGPSFPFCLPASSELSCKLRRAPTNIPTHSPTKRLSVVHGSPQDHPVLEVDLVFQKPELIVGGRFRGECL